jgi:UDP-N-acetylglucosamine:LPS N-acetylglucosamine transferase
MEQNIVAALSNIWRSDIAKHVRSSNDRTKENKTKNVKINKVETAYRRGKDGRDQ